MLQPNSQDDPVVQILILAYRRGLIVLQEQEKNKTANVQPLDGEKQSDETQNSGESNRSLQIGV